MTPVFVHGAGCTGAVFAAQLAAFPGSVAIDLPGHGAPGSATSIAQFADAVARELQTRGISGAIVCGSSMGGAVALELATRRDPHVRAIALLGSGARLRVAPQILESLERDFPAACRTLAGLFFAEPTPARVAGAIAMMDRVGAEQMLRDMRACDAFDVTDDLSGLSLPVAAITGERDVMTPPKYAEFVASRVPGAFSRIIPAAGHLAIVERPEETNEALRAFVTMVRGDGLASP